MDPHYHHGLGHKNQAESDYDEYCQIHFPTTKENIMKIEV
jgi:hypothetical protein